MELLRPQLRLRLLDTLPMSQRPTSVVQVLSFWRTEAETPSHVAERVRSVPPYGLAGGESGRPGVNHLFRRNRRVRLPGKTSLDVGPGDRLCIETPGGGGFGRPRR